MFEKLQWISFTQHMLNYLQELMQSISSFFYCYLLTTAAADYRIVDGRIEEKKVCYLLCSWHDTSNGRFWWLMILKLNAAAWVGVSVEKFFAVSFVNRCALTLFVYCGGTTLNDTGFINFICRYVVLLYSFS